MTLKRGQAALEFLMTYGWAFLVMIAVIAGIVALDPLGAAQTNINSCTLSAPLSCSSQALQLEAGGDMQFEMENVGTDSVTVTGLNASDTSEITCSVQSAGTFPLDLSAGDTATINCSDTNNAIDGSITAGDSYTFNLDSSYYVTSVGSDYTRLAEGQIQTTAVS